MDELISRLLDPEVILSAITIILYLCGRITKKQLIAEQEKQKGLISKDKAKDSVKKNVAKPLTGIINLLNYVPGLSAKIPLINKSIPDVAINLIEAPVGFLSDILHNLPFIGTNVNKK